MGVRIWAVVTVLYFSWFSLSGFVSVISASFPPLPLWLSAADSIGIIQNGDDIGDDMCQYSFIATFQ